MRTETTFPSVNLLPDRERAIGARRPALRLPLLVGLVLSVAALIIFLALQIVALRQ